MGQYRSLSVEDFGLGPMLSALVSRDQAVNSKGRAGGNGAQIVDLNVAGHGDEAARSNCLAHGLIQEGRNHAAVQVAGMAFKCVRNHRQRLDGAVGREQEFEAQPDGIGFSAAKAAVRSMQFGGSRKGFKLCHRAPLKRKLPAQDAGQPFSARGNRVLANEPFLNG